MFTEMGGHQSGTHAIDADASFRLEERQGTRQVDHCRFRRRIDRVDWPRLQTGSGARVHDASTVGTEELEAVLNPMENAAQVYVDGSVPIVGASTWEAWPSEYARIVVQNVDPTEFLPDVFE